METSVANQKIIQPEFLSGGGEMGGLIRSKDWSTTPLGSPETWPQSLRTTVSLCIASNFPIAIAWGQDRVQIYNDGYWPITGGKHPTSMGQDFKECWFSAWPVIGQAFEEASLGQTRFLENQRMFLDRYGYLEETFFTFSFSPILDESGGVGGLFHPVTELTQQTLAERRLNILRAISDNTVNAKTEAEASALILECLKDFELDLPFVLLYSIAANGKEANLKGSVGVGSDSPVAPTKINLEEQQSNSWPFAEVIEKGSAVPVEDLANIFGAFQCGPYPEPPRQALIFPVNLQGTAHNNYFLVTGVSSRRYLDEKYLLFYNLLTASINNALTKARAHDEERKKAEALAEIDKAKTVFFSNISHEFRTPLTLMLSSLEEIQDDMELSKEVRTNVELAHRNTLRLQKLVNTLLDFSRIAAGRMTTHFEPVDIGSLTTNLASSFRSAIEREGMQLVVDCPSLPNPVYADADLWEKIVLNLISNAFKYTTAGKIEIRIKQEGEWVKLFVSDTGIGIPPEQLSKIFDRFYRVTAAGGRTQEGTGIGLSLVQELVKLHGGYVEVESEVGKGSVFTITIPVQQKNISPFAGSESAISNQQLKINKTYVEEAVRWAVTVNGIPEKTVLSHGNSPQMKEFRVVVADDNSDMREYITRLLQINYEVIAVSNGEDAFTTAMEQRPDLIISDVMMPKLDGYGLLKKLRAANITKNIPLIFLSAMAGEEAKIEGMQAGADDYLVKPFSAKELTARAEAAIKIAKSRIAAQINLQNIIMQSPVAMAVYRGKSLVIEMANQRALDLWGKKREEVIDRPALEAFPEVVDQGFDKILNEVFTTGTPFIANEMPVALVRHNMLETIFVNFIYEPIRSSNGEVEGIVGVAIDVSEGVAARKKIEDSEQKLAYRTALLEAHNQASVDGILLVDAKGKIISYNQRFIEIWNMPQKIVDSKDDEAVLSFAMSQLLYPQQFIDKVKYLYENPTETSHDELEYKDGKIVERNGYPVIGNDGAYYAWSWTFRDITERKKIEQDLINTKEQLELTFKNIPAGVYLINQKGEMIYVNEKGASIYGNFIPEDLLAIKDLPSMLKKADELFERFDEDGNYFAAQNSPAFISLTTGLASQAVLLQIDRVTKERSWYYIQGAPLLTAEGKVSMVLVTSTDITLQKASEQAIRESEENFRQLADLVPQIIWTSRPDGFIDYYNRRWYDYTGFEANYGDQSWTPILHPDDVEICIATWYASVKTGKPYQIEYRFKDRTSGIYRWFLGKAVPIRDSSGTITKWFGTCTDIHDQKTITENLEKLVAERTKELERSNEDLQQFAHVASHDLKEPIRKVTTFGSRLESEFGDMLPEKAKLYLDKMQSAADRMFGLIDGVLTYSTVNALESSIETVDLVIIVQNIETDLEVVVQQKGAQITAVDLPVVKGSAVLLNQLFYNLINNSLKFSKPGVPPVISISAQKVKGEDVYNYDIPDTQKEFMQIRVCDNGIGFGPEYKEKIFKTFTRLNSRDKYEGTGLGLALCKKIIERHHGYIYATAKEGEGACFYVLLPV